MAWHERTYARWALRLAGLILIVLAALIARHLFAVPDPAAKGRPVAYLLALLFMISACCGTALAALGRHLFDPVDLPARWKVHSVPRDRSAHVRPHHTR